MCGAKWSVQSINTNTPMIHAMHPNSAGLFPRRIKRAPFLLRGTMLLGVGFLASLLISAAHHADIISQIVCVGGGVSVLLLLCVALFRSLLMPRLRDIGVHPAWSLLIFVHALSGLFLLALLLIPSDAFAGRRYVP